MEGPAKGIACIGWGSLCWDPRDLPCEKKWRTDGPVLPLEFARESGATRDARGNRITLVICPEGAPVPALWTYMLVPDLDEARKGLGRREYDKATDKWIRDHVGYWDAATGKRSGEGADIIAAWAAARNLAGAVWTSLPWGLRDTRHVMPTGDEVLDFIATITPEDLSGAAEYVRRAPSQIDTPYRRLMAERLGWASPKAEARTA